jgi:hypothetical protein
MTISDLEKPEAVEEYDDNGLTRSPTAVDDIGRADALQKTTSAASAKVKATIGNVLSATASRVTTRHITDPGPAPDGTSSFQTNESEQGRGIRHRSVTLLVATGLVGLRTNADCLDRRN